MRALELIIWMILLMMTPPLLGAMQVMPVSVGNCDPTQCGVAQTFITDTMNSTSLKQIDLDPSTIISWDNLTFALKYLVYGFFWILFLLSAIVIVAPALAILFHVPYAIGIYLSVGQWLIYMIAYIQLKKGGFPLPGLR